MTKAYQQWCAEVDVFSAFDSFIADMMTTLGVPEEELRAFLKEIRASSVDKPKGFA